MGKSERTLKKLVSLLVKKTKTSGYDAQAIVRRVEGNIAYVHIPGGVDETPVQLTIGAIPGDTVQIRVAGSRAWITGNATAPPTDDTKAEQAMKSVGMIKKVVNTVRDLAEKTAKIAGNTNQYFWHTETGTDTGAHITEIPKDDFLDDPTNGGGNLLARSNGVAVRDGLTELATFSADGMTVNKDGEQVAEFGEDIVLGDPDSPTFQIINSDNMLITEKTQSLNRTVPVNGSVSFSMVLDFSVSSIINVIVDIAELKKELGAELSYQTLYLSLNESQSSYSGAHTVSCSLNDKTVTVTMANTNGNYKGILRFYEVRYRSSTGGLSRMLLGARPIDSSEYALSIGNGQGNVVMPDWTYKSNALGVDWSGNFQDQMSFASLYTNGNQVGTSDANLECKIGNIFGSVFALKEYEWTSNEPDAGVTYEIIVKRSGYYHATLQYTWSSVGNASSRKVLGPSLNGSYAGFPAFGKDSNYETRSTRSLIYITSGSIIGIRGRSETAASTLYEAQLIIEPAWFL